MKTAMTLLEAAQHWVYGFNAIPTAMIARLMEQKSEEWTEVTMPTIGNTVYVDDASINGTITAQVEEYYQIILENGTNITAMVDDLTLVQPDILPMWSTMWSFGDTLDENWLKKGAGLTALSECGFVCFITTTLATFSVSTAQDTIFTRNIGSRCILLADFVGIPKSNHLLSWGVVWRFGQLLFLSNNRTPERKGCL